MKPEPSGEQKDQGKEKEPLSRTRHNRCRRRSSQGLQKHDGAGDDTVGKENRAQKAQGVGSDFDHLGIVSEKFDDGWSEHTKGNTDSKHDPRGTKHGKSVGFFHAVKISASVIVAHHGHESLPKSKADAEHQQKQSVYHRYGCECRVSVGRCCMIEQYCGNARKPLTQQGGEPCDEDRSDP